LLPQLQCLIARAQGTQVEGKMLTKAVRIALCGIGASVATLAQDETRNFRYSPIARLVGEGQCRAEVWRRVTLR